MENLKEVIKEIQYLKGLNQKEEEIRHKNKIILRKKKEKDYISKHKEEILKIIGNKCCFCRGNLKEIYQTKYSNLPKHDLKTYCKYLLPLCSNCLKEQKVNKNTYFKASFELKKKDKKSKLNKSRVKFIKVVFNSDDKNKPQSI
jgi:hypothetical protein